jgi:AcrR family transcriptional regulator
MTEKPKNQLILEAAFEVFSRKGFHGAKVDEIAEKAGIGKGTIYEYFRSKADVFQKMYLWYVEKYFAELEDGLHDEHDPVFKLKRLVRNHIFFLNNIKSLAGKLLTESSSNFDLGPEFKKTMMSTYQLKMDKIKAIIQEGINAGVFREMDVDLCATYFFGSLGGISHAMFLLNMDISPDEVAEKTIDILLNGIKSP